MSRQNTVSGPVYRADPLPHVRSANRAVAELRASPRTCVRVCAAPSIRRVSFSRATESDRVERVLWPPAPDHPGAVALGLWDQLVPGGASIARVVDHVIRCRPSPHDRGEGGRRRGGAPSGGVLVQPAGTGEDTRGALPGRCGFPGTVPRGSTPFQR